MFSPFVLLTFSILATALAEECKSMDLRNSPQLEADKIQRLKNCTAVTGFLQLLLMESSTADDFRDMVFPALREVTGFLLFFRAHGLKSIGQMFPNLAIIRGQKLIDGNSLIIYDMQDLEEIGLRNLQVIEQGTVRIERNPKLCDIESLDWGTLTRNKSNIFEGNGGLCPCQSNCLVQKYPVPKFNMSLCDKECLVGCTSPGSAFDCYACWNVKNPEGKCVAMCPAPLLTDSLSLRCVTESECVDAKRYVFQSTCIEGCPPGYSDQFYDGKTTKDTSKCQACNGKCPVYCDGGEVSSVKDAEKYQGCEIVTADLVIKLDKDEESIMETLTDLLSSVREIFGFVKVSWSSAITSLSFLQGITLIHGKRLENKHYSLMVFENNNLQDLWDPASDFKVVKGEVFIHNNMWLCPDKVTTFISKSQLNSSSVFWNNQTNGSDNLCNVLWLNTSAVVESPTSTRITWDAMKPSAGQKLMGYFVNYIPTPHTNVTHFYGKDFCSKYAWQTEFINATSLRLENNNVHSYVLSNLESLTQYAYFIRSDSYPTGATAQIQGQTSIAYFRTSLEQLSQVLDLKTYSKTSNSVTLSWNLLDNEEDEVNMYSVDVLYQPDDRLITERNFCEDPYEELGDTTHRRKTHKVIVETCTKEKFSLEACSEGQCRYKRQSEDIRRYKYYLRTERFRKEQAAKNRFTIPDLKPFTSYVFQFFACVKPHVCSPYAIHSERTARLADADKVALVLETESDSAAQLRISSVGTNNGHIVAFIIQTSINNSSVKSLCIPRSSRNESSWKYELKDLPLGLLSARVRAISLAGKGPFTPWFNVTVEGERGSANWYAWVFVPLVLAGCFTAYRKRTAIRTILRRYRRDGQSQILVEAAFDPEHDEEMIINQMQLNGKHYENRPDFFE